MSVSPPRSEKMEPKPSLSVRALLPSAFFLILFGWGGFFAVVYWSTPTGGTRWLFFFTAFLGLCGTALPAMAFLNQRFPSTPPASAAVIVRQAIWVAAYFPTLAWLRIGRVLTLPLALLLAFGLIMIEYLLRLRERSQWDPNQQP